MAFDLARIEFQSGRIHDCMPLGRLKLNDTTALAEGASDPAYALFALPTDYDPGEVAVNAAAFDAPPAGGSSSTVRAQFELSFGWNGDHEGPVCLYVYVPKSQGDVTIWGRRHRDSPAGGWIRTPDTAASYPKQTEYIAASVVSVKEVDGVEYLRILICRVQTKRALKFRNNTIDIGINS